MLLKADLCLNVNPQPLKQRVFRPEKSGHGSWSVRQAHAERAKRASGLGHLHRHCTKIITCVGQHAAEKWKGDRPANFRLETVLTEVGTVVARRSLHRNMSEAAACTVGYFRNHVDCHAARKWNRLVIECVRPCDHASCPHVTMLIRAWRWRGAGRSGSVSK